MPRPVAYQREPIELRDTLWSQGHATPLQFMRIVAWKSAKGLAWVTLAEAHAIDDVTRNVLTLLAPYHQASEPPITQDQFWHATSVSIGDAKRKSARGSGLRSLPGVELPVASAFLAILNPSVWPVIDVRALPKVLADVPYLRPTTRREVYQRYLIHLDEARRSHYERKTIHDVDQEAYRAAGSGDLPFRPTSWFPSAAT